MGSCLVPVTLSRRPSWSIDFETNARGEILRPRNQAMWDPENTRKCKNQSKSTQFLVNTFNSKFFHDKTNKRDDLTVKKVYALR